MLLRLIELAEVDAEPVSVEEVKDAARIDGREFDLLLPINIAAARRVAEHRAGRFFAARTMRAELDDWPCERLAIVPFESAAITYWNGSIWATLATNQYAAVALSNGISIEPAASVTWPTLPTTPGPRVRIDAVIPAAPDPAANLFIIAQAAFWTQNPSAAGDRKQEASPFLRHLLDACCVYS